MTGYALLALSYCRPKVITRQSGSDCWPQAWRSPSRAGRRLAAMARSDSRRRLAREGLLTTFPSAELKPVWRAEIASGYCGPTVADGRVYVTDRLIEPEQVERVHCFDEQTGKREWTYEYDCAYAIGYPAGPRAAVEIDDGRAYALGATGRLSLLRRG